MGWPLGRTFHSFRSSGEHSVLLLLILFVSHAMETQFAALSECLRAAVDAADERLGLCMHVHVLSQILFEREGLRTYFAAEGLDA